ncbi:MAG: ABC transporter permease [Planctomycetota bacterium]
MTFLIETLRLGLANLMLHKLRSLLTALGIIIGVGAVVAIAAYGEGSKQAALADIKELGANNIILRSVRPPESIEEEQEEQSGGGRGRGRGDSEEREVLVTPYGLTRLDMRRLDTESIQPIDEMVPLKRVGNFVYKNGITAQAAVVYGTTPTIGDAIPMTVVRGRQLTQQDGEQIAPVAVIGADAAQDLFRLEDPLGNSFSIDSQRFTVVGVLEPVGLATGRDINFDIYIPIETARARFGDQRMLPGGNAAELIEINELIIRVPEPSQVEPIADKVRRVIAVGHTQDDVQVIVPLELIKQEARTQLLFTIMMIVIASLSLIVGGIGIMNIMLASVTERIREIGVRRAMGATRRHIIAQFIVETTTLSVIGGLLGVVFGLALAGIAAILANYFPGIETPIPVAWSMIVGFVAAVVVGLLAGLYPAVRAAWQDPIVALRHD